MKGRRSSASGIRAVALVVLALSACAASSPTPHNTPGASTSGSSPRASLSASPSALDIATVPFYVLDSPMAGTTSTLRVGFADGRITRELILEWADRRWYAYSWMTGGQLAYSVSDPERTEIHVISAATGDDSTIEVQGHPTINADITLAPDGRSAFFVGRERVTPDLPGNPDIGNSTGVWKVDLRGDGVPNRILPPGAPTTADPFWTDGHIRSDLFITPDGRTLVAADWIGGISPARIRVVDLANGSTVDRTAVQIVAPIGISGRRLVGLGAPTGPTPMVVLDLDSGIARQIGEGDSLIPQRTVPIGVYIDNTLRIEGKTELHVIDLRSGVDAVAFRSEDRVYEPGLAGRLEAPADWIFMTPDASCLPPSDNVGVLLNWRTGELVRLGMKEAPPGTCNGQG